MFSRTGYFDACLPNTQRRYHMPSRSPIIFWLLLAATAAIDLVAAVGILDSGLANDHTIALFFSMAYVQINLLCLWAVAERRLMTTRWMAPVGAALVTSFVMTWADSSGSGHLDLETFATISVLLLFHVGLVLAITWFVIPPAWISFHATTTIRRGQYSTFQLLVLMTCVAAFFSALRFTDRFDDEWANIATFCFANMVIFCGTLMVLQIRRPWPLRVAICVLIAIVISSLANRFHTALADDMNAWAFFIVQAVAFALWLSYFSPATDTPNAEPEAVLPLGVA